MKYEGVEIEGFRNRCLGIGGFRTQGCPVRDLETVAI